MNGKILLANGTEESDDVSSSKDGFFITIPERQISLSREAFKPQHSVEGAALSNGVAAGEWTEDQAVPKGVATATAKKRQELSQLVEDITVVLPTLNEQEGIGAVIDKVRSVGLKNILVVDGGSTDETVRIAEQKGVSVIVQHGRGKTDAVDTATALVRTQYLAMMDADDSYDPMDIVGMIEQIQHCDQVIGSRMLGEKRSRNGQTEHLAKGHGFGNRILNWVFNALFGVHLTDVLSGLRIMRTSAVKGIRFMSTGFGAEAELTAQFLMEGRKVVEIPASFGRRLGNAKLGYLDGFRIFETTLRLAYEYNPLVFFMPAGLVLMVPGLGFLTYVLYMASFASSKTFHTSYALAGLGLFLTGLLFAGLGMMSFLMKRIELRQLRAIRSIGKES